MSGEEIPSSPFKFTTVYDRKKNTAANFANGGNNPPSLNSSIYFQSQQHLLQHCGSGLRRGNPSFATLECEQWIPYHYSYF